MWAANAQTSVAVSVTLDGFTVTGTAQLVGYEFDFGDGASTSTTTGGSEPQPAVRHTYETKGEYTLASRACGAASFVMTGPGITTPLPVDLRTAQLTTTRDVHGRRDPLSPRSLSTSRSAAMRASGRTTPVASMTIATVIHWAVGVSRCCRSPGSCTRSRFRSAASPTIAAGASPRPRLRRHRGWSPTP